MNNGDPVKPDSTQDKSNSAANTAGGSEGVKAVPRAGDVAVNQADQPAQPIGRTGKPTQPSQQDILDRIKAGELWMIVFTAVVALTTVAQFIQSGCNNASTSEQVDKIIGAANTQACAAKRIAAASDRNANAAERFSKSAYGINTQTQTAVTEFHRLANAAENTVKTNLDIARLEQRPWITVGLTIPVIDIDKPLPAASLEVGNSGRTFAKNVDLNKYSQFLPTIPTELPTSVPGAAEKSLAVLAPNLPYNSTFVCGQPLLN